MKAQKTTKRKSTFWSVVKLILFTAFTIYAIQAFVGQEAEINRRKAKVRELDAQIAVEQTRQAELRATRAVADTPSFMERQARAKLGMLRYDEVMFVDAAAR